MRLQLASSHVLFTLMLGCSATAAATEWDFKTDHYLKYYDAKESYREFYVRDTLQTTTSTQTSLARAVLTKPDDGVELNNLCFRMNTLAGKPGLFSRKGTIEVYYVNLTKIARVENNGPSGSANDRYFTETVTLRDGSKFQTVNFDGRHVLACGIGSDGNLKIMPQRWEQFSTYGSDDCSYDESRMDRSKWPYTELSPVFSYGRPLKDAMVYVGFNQLSERMSTSFDVDQAPLAAKFEQCSSSSARFADLEKRKRGDLDLAYEKRKQQEAWEREQEARRRQQLQADLIAEAAGMRKSIAIGTKTNCGLVFDIKKPMIGVQTMIGMQYIHVDQLWGPSAGCHFHNGVYTGTSG